MSFHGHNFSTCREYLIDGHAVNKTFFAEIHSPQKLVDAIVRAIYLA